MTLNGLVASAARRPLSLSPRLAFLAACSVTIGTAGAIGLLAGERPTLALIAAAAGLAGILTAARPDTATLIVIAILYSNAAAVAVRTYGVPYFFGAAFPIVLVAPLAYHLIALRRPLVLPRASFFLLLLALVYVLGTVFASDALVATEGLYLFATSGVGLYLAVVNVVRDVRTLRRIVWILLTVGAFLGGLSALQTVTGSYTNDFFGFAQVNWPGIGTTGPVDGGGPPRAAGPIGEQNRYAQAMLALVPIGALAALRMRPRIARLALGGATLLTTLGMIAAFSRGAALGMMGVIALLVLYRYVRLRHVLILALGGFVLFAAFPRYAERLANLGALTQLEAGAAGATAGGDVGNLRSRATQMMAGVLMFIDHPLVGVGPGMYDEHYQDYADRVNVGLFDARVDPVTRQAHSLYAEVAAEGGGLGLFAFFGLVAVTARELHRARTRWLHRRPELADLATGFILALGAYLGTGVFLHLSYERYYWILVALAGATAHVLLHVSEAEVDGQLPARDQSPNSQSA